MGVVLCTTAVDWTKLKLTARVITAAAAAHETAFKPLFNIAFMVVLPFSLSVALCTMQFAVVMVLYITTSLDECQAISLKIFWGVASTCL